MKKVKVEKKKNGKAHKSSLTTFDEHLDKRYGRMGSAKRNEFEIKAKAFAIGEIKGEELRLASMTQEQLAEKAKWTLHFAFLAPLRLIFLENVLVFLILVRLIP